MTKPRAAPKGRKPDKLMRDALILALMREVEDGAAKKLNLIAAKLVEKVLGGDIQAIKEVCDRVDGRYRSRGQILQCRSLTELH